MGGNGNGNGKAIALQGATVDEGDVEVFAGNEAALFRRYGRRIIAAARGEIEAMFAEFCNQRGVVVERGNRLMTSSGRTCMTLGEGLGPYPAMEMPGCPVNVDACAFPALDTDLRLFSWPEIEAQMWDTDTTLDVILAGAFPVVAGGSVLLEQQLRRTITWIPDEVMISTTWTGTPQPGLVTLQWSSGPKGAVAGRVNFSNVQRGTQYEGGATPNTSTTPIKVKFPTYRGVDSIPIGALSSLSLLLTLDAAATSTLAAVDVRVYHKKSSKSCCKNCKAGLDSCTCGG